jgi:hypothetical protein
MGFSNIPHLFEAPLSSQVPSSFPKEEGGGSTLKGELTVIYLEEVKDPKEGTY